MIHFRVFGLVVTCALSGVRLSYWRGMTGDVFDRTCGASNFVAACRLSSHNALAAHASACLTLQFDSAEIHSPIPWDRASTLGGFYRLAAATVRQRHRAYRSFAADVGERHALIRQAAMGYSLR